MTTNQAIQRCRWCDRERRWPLICLNTRDMTERAIDGEDACHTALEKLGGGEAGMRHVDLNRANRRYAHERR